MNKWTSAIIGAAVGAAASTGYLFLFAPARGTTFDENYQSRLDWALAEGKKAGEERKRELVDELMQARVSPAKTTPVEDLLPSDDKSEKHIGESNNEMKVNSDSTDS